jgi:hypothetical protein
MGPDRNYHANEAVGMSQFGRSFDDDVGIAEWTLDGVRLVELLECLTGEMVAT